MSLLVPSDRMLAVVGDRERLAAPLSDPVLRFDFLSFFLVEAGDGSGSFTLAMTFSMAPRLRVDSSLFFIFLRLRAPTDPDRLFFLDDLEEPLDLFFLDELLSSPSSSSLEALDLTLIFSSAFLEDLFFSVVFSAAFSSASSSSSLVSLSASGSGVAISSSSITVTISSSTVTVSSSVSNKLGSSSSSEEGAKHGISGRPNGFPFCSMDGSPSYNPKRKLLAESIVQSLTETPSSTSRISSS
mmetsp:Transcript_6563/g.15469  ORF Transcript_6563/g.15469 Transcript_6563/m.15469 type:complete len:242 (+) Transcript_6563:901-1626(+)